MAIEWIKFVLELPKILKDLGGIIASSASKKKLILSELKNNLKQFENANRLRLNYDQLIELLSNDSIIKARQEGFVFSSIKIGKIQKKHIKEKRNEKYLGKNCEWLLINISDKIDELKKLKTQKSLINLKELNMALQFSNLLFKMKLLVEFIK